MAASALGDIIRPGINRGLDFVNLDELRKRTGVTPGSVLKFALSEMLCNALDKDATEIDIDIQIEGKFHRLVVRDNGGKKITLKDIKLILDFENKASSKRGLLRVSRGYLGNALKCIFGYSYGLAKSKGLTPPDIVVQSAGYEFKITLTPDRVKGVIGSEIVTAEKDDDGFTTFIVKTPVDGDLNQLQVGLGGCIHYHSNPSVLKDLVLAASIVNPTRRICYNIFGEKGAIDSPQGGRAIRRQETSILWYTRSQFEGLYEDFVRARPEIQLKEFIPLFRGFTGKKTIGEILQAVNSCNQDCQGNSAVQFFPATPISTLSKPAVEKLFTVMRAKAKPIAKRSIPSVLGLVGEEAFEKIREQNGWERLRYIMIPSVRMECPHYQDWYSNGPCGGEDHVEFPYLVELAVFDRRRDDQEGLKVYQCVNFMASMEDIFSKVFNIHYRLGRVGIKADTPVTVVVHLVSPVLKWLNYGKTGLDE